MVNMQCANVKLWMDLGGLLSTQEAQVALALMLLSCLATSLGHP